MGDPYQQQLGAEIKKAFAEKDWPGALTIIDLWCQLYPEHAQGWYWRAGCQMQIGNLDQALVDAECALDLNPADQNTRTLRDNLVLKIAEERSAHEAVPVPEKETEPEPYPEAPKGAQSEESVPDPEPDPEIVSFEVDEPVSQDFIAAAGPPAAGSSSARKSKISSNGTRPQKLPMTVIAAVLVVVFAISWAVFDRIRTPDLRVNQKVASEIRKRIYASVVPPHPSVVSRTTCDASRLTEYVEVFGKFRPDPTAWESAKYCLEVFGTGETVVELLDLLRPGQRRWGSSALFQKTNRRGTISDVRSVLVRMRDDISKPLVTALGDDSFDVRKVAAEILAYRRNEEDARALVRNSKSTSSEVREVVASVLGDLVGSRQLAGPEGFELMRWMAADESVQVRFEVAEALIVFEGTQAKALAESMTRDPSRKVSDAARKVVTVYSRKK